MIDHPFTPVYNEKSEILILGTFPSIKSRENEFYYGHPQNRFWKVLEAIFSLAKNPAFTQYSKQLSNESFTKTQNSLATASIDEKKEFLLQHKIALWDVIASCEITGSADASIANVTPNDILGLLNKTNIKKIFCNGTKAFELYNKYVEQQTAQKAIKLPSTSPANAIWTLDKLIAKWKEELI